MRIETLSTPVELTSHNETRAKEENIIIDGRNCSHFNATSNMTNSLIVDKRVHRQLDSFIDLETQRFTGANPSGRTTVTSMSPYNSHHVINVNLVTTNDLELHSTSVDEIHLCKGNDSTYLEGATLPVMCALTSAPGYIIYSACGSFWLPMLVMLFFYVKIYRTATTATNALRMGVVSQRVSTSTAAGAGVAVNMRVHRGGGKAATPKHRQSASSARASWLDGGELHPPPHFRLRQFVDPTSSHYSQSPSLQNVLLVTSQTTDSDVSDDVKLQHCQISARRDVISCGSDDIDLFSPIRSQDVTGHHSNGVRSDNMDVQRSRTDRQNGSSLGPWCNKESNGNITPMTSVTMQGCGRIIDGETVANGLRGILHVRSQLRRLNREKKVWFTLVHV